MQEETKPSTVVFLISSIFHALIPLLNHTDRRRHTKPLCNELVPWLQTCCSSSQHGAQAAHSDAAQPHSHQPARRCLLLSITISHNTALYSDFLLTQPLLDLSNQTLQPLLSSSPSKWDQPKSASAVPQHLLMPVSLLQVLG